MPNRTSTILVVDDEDSVRRLLVDCLEQEGYRVFEAATGQDLFRELAARPIDLVTLDLKLGGDDGLKLAREVRAKRNIPIVMITGKADPIDRIVGLELGADDYIAKPFHLREVLARVRAVLRRYHLDPNAQAAAGPAATGIYRFEGRVLDLTRREYLDRNGQSVELTTTELDLLAVLVRSAGRVLSRDQIMDQLKGHDWSPFDRSIDAMVARLRRKIEPENETPRLIKTVRGVGYVFAGALDNA